MTKRKDVDSIPTGKFSRASIAGSTATQIGVKKLGFLARKPFVSQENRQNHQDKHDDEVAELLFKGLTKLRGSALKVAQMMSLEMGILPEKLRKELYKSHYQVPPLNRALIRRLIISEFGKSPEEVFKVFEGEAFAAASLGQVHDAISFDGDKLAVKVQYPGIGDSLKSDLQIARQIFAPSFQSEYVNNALKEIEHRLTEEIDYDLELENTQWFYDHNTVEGIHIPKTYKLLSSKSILTTEKVEDGKHMDQWLATNPTQEERDRAAQLIYDFFIKGFFEFNRMHADPNPGNYLFKKGGDVAVIDFGCVKKYEPEFATNLAELWRAHLREDSKKIISFYSKFGVGKGDLESVQKIYDDYLKPFGQWLRVPYQEGIFDFGSHPDYCEQGTKFIREIITRKEMNGFTTETVLCDRNIYGLFRIFGELKAKVRMSNKWIY